MGQPEVLVVAPEKERCKRRCDLLTEAGYSAVAAASVDAGAEVLARRRLPLALVHTRRSLPRNWEILNRTSKGTRVVVLAEESSVTDAVDAMRAGAADYLAEPCGEGQLLQSVQRAVGGNAAPGFVAEDPATLDLFNLAGRVASKDVSVLLSGESGTGKEVLARYIHRQSSRVDKPFVAVNCAAIPEQMLEAVLFGFERGAFTGAVRSHAGKFEQAQGGTLLLDEVSEIDLGLQAKLLRVLQEQEVERLCGTDSISLDVRVLATTNRDLKTLVSEGRFREDLYYRLHVFPLKVPPLRLRQSDILPLARAFAARFGGVDCNFSAQAQSRLLEHSWPGNVRELENVIQRALVLSEGRELPAASIQFDDGAPVRAGLPSKSLGGDLREREQRLILETLARTRGSRKVAARKLGISDRTLRYKLARMREDGVELPGPYGAECA